MCTLIQKERGTPGLVVTIPLTAPQDQVPEEGGGMNAAVLNELLAETIRLTETLKAALQLMP